MPRQAESWKFLNECLWKISWQTELEMAAMAVRWEVAQSHPCNLGEGISWHQASSSWPHAGFFYVDINACQLHFVELASARRHSWDWPERIGWWIPAGIGQGWYAGFQSGIARVRLLPCAEIVSWVCRPLEAQPSLRFNDAKADPMGRVWTGTMNWEDESRPDGALWRCGDTLDLLQIDSGYKVPNGPAILPEASLMLHSDSARRTIYAFDFDAAAGTLSNKRVWALLKEEEGYPDGMNFDAQGCLWLAHWGAGLITRRGLDGRVLDRVELPVKNVSNLAFGGDRLDRLWVTTARAGLSNLELAAQPLAGAVFEVLEHGAQGRMPYSAEL